MSETVLKSFLLFDFSDWQVYSAKIIQICQLSIYPLAVISILFDLMSEAPDPLKIFKRVVLAQIILVFIPNNLPQIIDFGFKLADEIVKDEKSGIMAHWIKAQEVITSEAVKQKKEIGFAQKITSMFDFKKYDLFSNMTMTLVVVCLFLAKIIFSVVYYSFLLMAAPVAIISIIPYFKSYNVSLVRSVLFLIMTTVIISIVLAFINKVTIFHTTEAGGFEGSVSTYAQMIVLCIAILGSFGIAHALVNGAGPESWGAKMGTMLSAGMAYNTMTKMQNMAFAGAKKAGAKAGGLGLKGIGHVGNHALGGLKSSASPLIEGGKSVKESLKQKAQNSASNIPGIKDTPNNDSYLKAHGINPESANQPNKGPSNYSEALKNRVAKEDGTTGLRKSVNPINHLKATKDLAGSKLNTAKSNLREQMGVPEGSSNLSFKDRAVLATNRVLNGKDSVKNIPATRPGLNNSAKAPGKVSSSKPISNKQVPNIKKNEGDKK